MHSNGRMITNDNVASEYGNDVSNSASRIARQRQLRMTTEVATRERGRTGISLATDLLPLMGDDREDFRGGGWCPCCLSALEGHTFCRRALVTSRRITPSSPCPRPRKQVRHCYLHGLNQLQLVNQHQLLFRSLRLRPRRFLR